MRCRLVAGHFASLCSQLSTLVQRWMETRLPPSTVGTQLIAPLQHTFVRVGTRHYWLND